ncbi:MAG TPA: hypothetical protein VF412_00180 [Bdellovibrio sp.]|uniref:hypothetical protein n=1 Tax=Bdellovibrio sp. TaxID=28201 RepID=UPI002F229788
MNCLNIKSLTQSPSIKLSALLITTLALLLGSSASLADNSVSTIDIGTLSTSNAAVGKWTEGWGADPYNNITISSVSVDAPPEIHVDTSRCPIGGNIVTCTYDIRWCSDVPGTFTTTITWSYVAVPVSGIGQTRNYTTNIVFHGKVDDYGPTTYKCSDSASWNAGSSPSPTPTPTPPDQGLPDLSVSNLVITPTEVGSDGIPVVQKGAQLTATFDVKGTNISTSDDRSAFVTLQYANQTLASTVTLAELQSGVSHKSFYFTINDSDLNPITRTTNSVVVKATVNGAGTIQESDTSNNSITQVLRVPGYSLKIEALDANEQPTSAQITMPVSNLTAVPISIGGFVKFTLLDETGKPVSGTYQYNGSPNLDSTSIPLDTKNGLYFDQIGLLFNGGQSLTSQNLFMVHLGTQNLIITPSDSSKSPITIVLQGIKPSNVGTDLYDCTFQQSDGTVVDTQYSNCDALIVEAANSTGLPPQFIKAEIWAESDKHSFSKTSYRYEPNYDVRYSSNDDRTEMINGIRQLNQRFAASGKYVFLASKNTLTKEQIHLRSGNYCSLSDGTMSNIPDNYETASGGYKPLTALNLIKVDILKNDYMNWFKDDIKFPDDRYNIVAQTILASSFGMMQLMYLDAIEQMGYTDDNSNPLSLFRPAINVKLGSKFLAKKLRFVTGDVRYGIDNFINFASYGQTLKYASAGYKSGGGKKRYLLPDKVKYANSVYQTMTTDYWMNSPFTK